MPVGVGRGADQVPHILLAAAIVAQARVRVLQERPEGLQDGRRDVMAHLPVSMLWFVDDPALRQHVDTG